MRKWQILGAAILLTVFLPNAYAHYFWIDVNNHYPGSGEEIIISVIGGHRFPEGERADASMLEDFYLIAPEGAQIPLKIETEKGGLLRPVRVRLDKEGTYLVAAVWKSGFITKTTTGWKRQSKQGLEEIIESFCTAMCAKSILVVGKSSGDGFMADMNQQYEIIPLRDPGRLSKGDMLPLELKRDGKTHRNWLFARHEKFSDEEDAFSYTTRRCGKDPAKIELLESGKWLVLAWGIFPYPDTKVTDISKLRCTLTFAVK